MNLPTYDDALERVLDEIVRPDARSVDADGTFPRRGIDALGEAGILGLTVAEPFGGGGALALTPSTWSAAWRRCVDRRRWWCSCTTPPPP